MDSRIDEIEEKINEISQRLDIYDQTDEIKRQSVEELHKGIVSSKNLAEKFIEKFELNDLKLKNIESEFELIHTEIRTLKLLIETIEIKLKGLE